MQKRSIHMGKLFAFVGVAAVAGFLYGGMQFSTRAQTVAVPAPESHTSCLPVKDYPNSNGYTESYTRPNNCHSKKVMFYSGPYYRMGNGWRARCPAGATLYVHNRAHYMMSPTMDGDYDGGAGGGAHYYCVDAGGNQVEPVPGESEANLFHTHTSDGLAKAYVVDSDTSYYYSSKTGQWVTCQGGYQGPFQNDSSYVDVQNGNFNNHFHCKNPNYVTGSASDNPEAAPVALTQAAITSLVGSFSTSDTGTKDQFVDKGPWGVTAPFGTVACVHTNSDKAYFSTTGTCPAASQFPPKADTTPPVISAVNATNITQTGAVITWTTNENADSQVEYDLVPNYFTSPKLTTLDSTMAMTHSVNMTGLTPGTTYYYRARSKDATGNLTYFYNSFATLAVSTYSFELTKTSPAIGTVEAKAGTTASIKIKLKNTSTASTEFPVYCDSGFGSFMGHMYYLNADGTTGAKFNSYAGSTSLPSGNVTLAAGTEKSFEFKFDIPASGSVGTWTVKCHTYPLDNTTRNSLTDKKQEITDTFTVTSTIVTPGSDTPATVVANALTQ